MTSLAALKPECASVSLADDMGVPVSQVPKAVKAFKEIVEKYNVTVATYGHASDGNLHTKMVIDPTDKDEWERGVKVVNEIFDVCIALGGTVTGEHGVGISKAPNFKNLGKGWQSLVKAVHSDGKLGYIQPVGAAPKAAGFDATDVYGFAQHTKGGKR